MLIIFIALQTLHEQFG